MIINKRAGYINLQLEDKDFEEFDWRGFIAQIKQLPGAEYDASLKMWLIPDAQEKPLAILVQEYTRDPRQIDMFL